MATLRKRKFRKELYYYLEHRFKINGKVKSISKYLGKKIPENLEKLKIELEWNVMRSMWKNQLKSIKENYKKYMKKLPAAAKNTFYLDFMTHFIYDSGKIEGSRLTYQDTVGLFVHGATPKNKPIKDIREAEGYKNAFESMTAFKGNLTLRKIKKWHSMVFNASFPEIAGKIRMHPIIVVGSNVSFPRPEEVPRLFKEFIRWHSKNEKRYAPAEFAALVHLKFVTIHPFSDGNGRISRLLANFVLHKADYPLFNIKFGDRMSYYHNLKQSQLLNDEKNFVRFFIRKYISQHKKYEYKKFNFL